MFVRLLILPNVEILASCQVDTC